MRPLSELWSKPPAYIGAVLSVLRYLENPSIMRVARSMRRSAQQFQLGWTGEAPL